MDKYYYNTPSLSNTNDTIGIIIVASIIVSLIIYAYWPLFESIWERIKDRNKIKSFVVRVAGLEMTEKKFNYLTDDINWILKGTNMSKIKEERKKKLPLKNIISITDFPGEHCHYFVVWFRR